MAGILEKVTEVNDRFNQIQALTFYDNEDVEKVMSAIRTVARESLGHMFELMNMIEKLNNKEE
jgi:Holliday junction resolvasome RuvABC ATP-dependent DNA helicase subunit